MRNPGNPRQGASLHIPVGRAETTSPQVGAGSLEAAKPPLGMNHLSHWTCSQVRMHQLHTRWHGAGGA